MRTVNRQMLVAWSNIVVVSKPLVTMDQMREAKHSFEEADHQMVSYSIDFAQNEYDPETILDVYSLDTGVLFLLMAFHPEIPTATTLLRLNNEKLSIPTLVGLFQKLWNLTSMPFLQAMTTSFVLLLSLEWPTCIKW